jgi:hypothetical protein
VRIYVDLGRDSEWIARFRLPSWDLALVVVRLMRGTPPLGHRTVSVSLWERKEHSGRRCSMRVSFFKSNRDEPGLSENVVRQLILDYVALAEGESDGRTATL